MEMSFEDYPRGLRHALIYTESGAVVYETQSEGDAIFTLALFRDRCPGENLQLVMGMPYRPERPFQ